MTTPAIDLAKQHHAAGRLDQAEPLYLQIVANQPDHPEALALLGVLYYQQGRPADAIPLLQRAADANPQSPENQYNLGLALAAREDWNAAVAAFQRAITLRPDYASAHNALGNCLRAVGDLPHAVAAYRKAVSLKPELAGFWNNLGIGLQAIAQTPEAMEAFNRALALKPDYVEAMSNLANVLWIVGRPHQAAETCRRALAIQPRFAGAWNNLGNALRDCGQVPEATHAYSQAVMFAHHDPGFHSNQIYSLHFQPNLDAAQVFRQHVEWNERHAAHLSAKNPPHSNDRNPDRPLRIGYVSPDFVDHSVAYFLEAPFAFHDKSNFKIYAYADVPKPDATTARLQQSVTQWRNVTGLPDDRLAQLIRDDQIDILVDLAGHTGHNRLLTFARKPAPIQITHIGYPYSTGMTAIDYRFTDAHADPPGMTEQYHSEKIARLPNTFLCFTPPAGAPDVGPLPAQTAGRITFGSFNSLAKISSVTIEMWIAILRAVPNSRLLIKSIGGLAEDAPRRRLLSHFTTAGITADRIELRERIQSAAGHLELYNQIDIALDTFPYHGTKTTCDALWMGVPVVTLAGPTHPSRVGVSLLNNVELLPFAANRPDEYAAKAATLAADLSTLAKIRAGLRDRMKNSPLCDGKTFAAALEAEYRRLWIDYCRRT
jgi:protein O-GlcNAc transferase